MRHDWTGKVALVTGSARGIGKAIVSELEDLGVRTAAADIIPPDAWAPGHPASSRHYLDVGSMTSCSHVVETVVAEHGRLDYLVNCAAIIRRKPVSEMDEADFTDVVDVNLSGVFRMCRWAYAPIVAVGGAIVNIASTNGLVAVAGKAGYTASKGGLIHLTRSLAVEWAPAIRVNAVAPTMVETDINAPQRADPAWMAEQLASIPMGRPATVHDVTAAVTFLLSSDAGMITGHTIPVDGGAIL